MQTNYKDNNQSSPPPPSNTNIKDNIYAVLLYSLCLVTALGFNEIVLSTFNHFSKKSSKFVAQVIYVFVMFSITILVAYLVDSTLKN